MCGHSCQFVYVFVFLCDPSNRCVPTFIHYCPSRFCLRSLVVVFESMAVDLHLWQNGHVPRCFLPHISLQKWVGTYQQTELFDFFIFYFAKCRADVKVLFITQHDLLANILLLKHWCCASTLCINTAFFLLYPKELIRGKINHGSLGSRYILEAITNGEHDLSKKACCSRVGACLSVSWVWGDGWHQCGSSASKWGWHT